MHLVMLRVTNLYFKNLFTQKISFVEIDSCLFIMIVLFSQIWQSSLPLHCDDSMISTIIHHEISEQFRKVKLAVARVER